MIEPLAVRLNFDGSCWPNPGGEASYGWHASAIGHEGILLRAEGSGPVTDEWTSNNVAEWRGLEAGLSWLSCLRLEGGLKQVVIVGDSQLVIRQLNGDWACKKPHLALLRDECHRLLRGMNCEWKAQWVPRAQNSEADVLSKAGRRTPSAY